MLNKSKKLFFSKIQNLFKDYDLIYKNFLQETE